MIESVTEMDIWGSWVEVGMVVAAFISGIIIVILPRLSKKKKKRREFIGQKFTQLHSQIHEELTKLRLSCDCARTYVVQFHNGGEYLEGSAIRKWSITHESVHLGIENTIHKTQECLATLYPDMIQLLYADKSGIFLPSLMDEHSAFRAYMAARNVSGFVLKSIRDPKGINIYGYVCCEWSSLSKLDAIEAEDEYDLFEQLKESSKVIEGLILTQKKDYR